MVLFNYKRKGDKKMTEIEKLDNYLNIVCKNSSKCASCAFCHDGICFLAYKCIANDFNFFKEDKKKKERVKK